MSLDSGISLKELAHKIGADLEGDPDFAGDPDLEVDPGIDGNLGRERDPYVVNYV